MSMIGLLDKKSSVSAKIATNTLYQLVGKFVSMSVTVFATLIITRYYGREAYGWFNLMQNFPALFFIIADFGINAIAARELAHKEHEIGKYLGNIIVLRILLSLVIMLLGTLLILFFPYANALKLGISISMFLVLTQSLYATTNLIFQIRLRYDLSTISYVVGSLLVLALLLIGVALKLDIVWINSFYIFGGILTFLLNLVFIKRLGVAISLKIDKSLTRLLLAQSLPLGLMFIFSQINFKADAILLSILPVPFQLGYNNADVVALYGLPYKIFEVALVLPTFFMNAAYPIFLRHLKEDKQKLLKTFKYAMFGLGGLGVLVSVFGVLLAPLAIDILGGSAFIDSILSMRLLFVGMVVFYVTQPIAWLIVTLGRQKLLPVIYLISAGFNLAANMILIPRYSYFASSVVTWVSELVILCLLVLAAKNAWKAYEKKA